MDLNSTKIRKAKLPFVSINTPLTCPKILPLFEWIIYSSFRRVSYSILQLHQCWLSDLNLLSLVRRLQNFSLAFSIPNHPSLVPRMPLIQSPFLSPLGLLVVLNPKLISLLKLDRKFLDAPCLAKTRVQVGHQIYQSANFLGFFLEQTILWLAWSLI